MNQDSKEKLSIWKTWLIRKLLNTDSSKEEILNLIANEVSDDDKLSIHLRKLRFELNARRMRKRERGYASLGPPPCPVGRSWPRLCQKHNDSRVRADQQVGKKSLFFWQWVFFLLPW